MASVRGWLKHHVYLVAGLATLTAYPIGRAVLVKQSPIIMVSVSVPLTFIVLFGLWGWFWEKTIHHESPGRYSKTVAWAIFIIVDLALAWIVRAMGIKTIFG